MSPARLRYLRLYYAHGRIDAERQLLCHRRELGRPLFVHLRRQLAPPCTIDEAWEEYERMQEAIEARLATLVARQRRLPPLPPGPPLGD